MRLDDFLARLEGVRKAPAGHKAKCPAHEDHDPSLSVTEGTDGRILVRCWAGCETVDVIAALDLEWADLFPDGQVYDGFDFLARNDYRRSP